MSFEYVREIPKPKEILKTMPLSKDLIAVKKKRDQDIREIFTSASNKFVLIIGPCSAHDEEAVCDFIR